MSKIQWQDNFNIGIDEIDLQHKKLLQIFNEMYALSTDESQNYRVLIGKTLKNCLLILITIFRKKRTLRSTMIIPNWILTKIFIKILSTNFLPAQN